MAEQSDEIGELPLLSAGHLLREARQAEGLSIDAISSRTKIAARHLEAIEEDRFSDLASRTYAIGFSRSYARALGLDEARIADRVRAQLDAEENNHPASHTDKFEPGDPARVPPSLVAWLAGLALVGAIVVLLVFWSSYLSPAGEMPDLTTDEAAAQAQPSPKVTSAPRNATAGIVSGPVVITALKDRVWVKVSDGAGKQLYQKEMALDESYTVPPDAQSPVLETARPDVLRLSAGGKIVPPLSDRPEILRNVPLDAASLLARTNAGQSAASTAPAANGSASSASTPGSARSAGTAPVKAGQ